MNSFIPWTGGRRTAAGEMLPYALRASGNNKLLPTFAAGIGRQIACAGSAPGFARSGGGWHDYQKQSETSAWGQQLVFVQN